jgi:hypothetical protein
VVEQVSVGYFQPCIQQRKHAEKDTGWQRSLPGYWEKPTRNRHRIKTAVVEVPMLRGQKVDVETDCPVRYSYGAPLRSLEFHNITAPYAPRSKEKNIGLFAAVNPYGSGAVFAATVVVCMGRVRLVVTQLCLAQTGSCANRFFDLTL